MAARPRDQSRRDLRTLGRGEEAVQHPLHALPVGRAAVIDAQRIGAADLQQESGIGIWRGILEVAVAGRDAEAALSWLCANDVARPPGRVIYTQLLNERGAIE